MKLRICMYGFVRMYVSVNHINPPNIRTFLKKIKSFSNNNRNFLEKITSFFKNVLIFFATAGTSTSDIFHKAPNRQIM